MNDGDIVRNLFNGLDESCGESSSVVLRAESDLSAFQICDVDESGGAGSGAGGLEHSGGECGAVGELVELLCAVVVQEDMEGEDILNGGDRVVLGEQICHGGVIDGADGDCVAAVDVGGELHFSCGCGRKTGQGFQGGGAETATRRVEQGYVEFVCASDRRRFQPEARSVTGGQASSPLLGFTQNLTGDLQAGHRWIRRRHNKSKLEVGKLFLGGRSATKLLYENRKNAALEGGLIGLAAATVGLTFEAAQHLERPTKSRSLDDAAVKISAEEYEYEIFRSPEEYKRANLEPPRYDLPQKYTPQKAAVTVAIRPPLPESGSQGAMRSFPVSACPPAPAKKISLGSKKAGSARSADPSTEAPSAEALVPAGLPLTATHASDLSGGHGETRAAKHGKEKEKEKEVDVEEVAPVKRARRDGSGSTTPVIDVLMKHGDEPPAALLSRICAAAPPPEKTSGWSTALVGERIACDLIQMAHSVTDLFARAKDGDEIHRREVAPLKKSLAKRDLRIKELEGKLKTAEETGRRILERADLGEKILTDPVLLARHICRGRETGEAVLDAISRTPVGEDLMYEFGTWAFNSGRRAMQNDVKTALEVSMEETDLPTVLAVLPEEVPDPGPTPFTSVPEGSNLPVPVVEVSAGPSAEAATTTGPPTELGATLSAGPSAEGDGEPRADPATETS
nr:histone-lysine N-methyltransferase SETD1A-like [Ipomoea batatas]